MEAKKSMFNVSFEINIEGSNPLDVAKEVQRWMKDESDWLFFVQNDETKELFTVDLQENDEDAVLPTNFEDYSPVIQK